MRPGKYSIRSEEPFSVLTSASTADVLTTAMSDGSILLIDGDGRGAVVICVNGTLCLTQPCDPEDHILQSGDKFIIDKKGLIAVTALADTRINISMGMSSLNSGTGQASLTNENKYDGTITDIPF